ncbi:MAG: hypothetical protein KatS3mg109_0925 [Pirellulaceae bacterium]|nr:MAG: hypothetical protein KatS3mg109_0925 [Pirellulaceae bacterium]
MLQGLRHFGHKLHISINRGPVCTESGHGLHLLHRRSADLSSRQSQYPFCTFLPTFCRLFAQPQKHVRQGLNYFLSFCTLGISRRAIRRAGEIGLQKAQKAQKVFFFFLSSLLLTPYDDRTLPGFVRKKSAKSAKSRYFLGQRRKKAAAGTAANLGRVCLGCLNLGDGANGHENRATEALRN